MAQVLHSISKENDDRALLHTYNVVTTLITIFGINHLSRTTFAMDKYRYCLQAIDA